MPPITHKILHNLIYHKGMEKDGIRVLLSMLVEIIVDPGDIHQPFAILLENISMTILMEIFLLD